MVRCWPACAVVKAHWPATQMIAFRERAPAMERSWRARQVQELGEPKRSLTNRGSESLSGSCRDLVGLADDILLVEDHALIAAMQQAHRELGVRTRARRRRRFAALTTYREQFKGQLIGTS